MLPPSLENQLASDGQVSGAVRQIKIPTLPQRTREEWGTRTGAAIDEGAPSLSLRFWQGQGGDFDLEVPTAA